MMKLDKICGVISIALKFWGVKRVLHPQNLCISYSPHVVLNLWRKRFSCVPLRWTENPKKVNIPYWGPCLTTAKVYQNIRLQTLTQLLQYIPSLIYPVVCSVHMHFLWNIAYKTLRPTSSAWARVCVYELCLSKIQKHVCAQAHCSACTRLFVLTCFKSEWVLFSPQKHVRNTTFSSQIQSNMVWLIDSQIVIL